MNGALTILRLALRCFYDWHYNELTNSVPKKLRNGAQAAEGEIGGQKKKKGGD